MAKTAKKPAPGKKVGKSIPTGPGGRMMPPEKGVSVRMYRQGLGDCFLLAFPTGGKDPFYMMIDCGVLLGTPDAPAKMAAVVDDVVQATGGHLGLLAVTHEHWDHNSGFIQADGAFKDLAVHRIWLAWTEDSRNPLAAKLKAKHAKAKQALAALAPHVAQAGAPSGPGVECLLGFFGHGLGVQAGSSTSDAMAAASKLSQSPPRFCRPADPPLTLPEVPGARFYVLGPPEDEKRLGRMNPSKSHPETYGLVLGSAAAFLAAGAQSGGLADPLSYPFDERLRIAPAQASQDPFFQKSYFATTESWRTIEADWLEAAGGLALQLDSETNNTSLVLAIELTQSGKVLLFAADAQVGNWLSWNDKAWDGVTAKDLLGRTVLYKVGHHGSHNATLREQGLEEMACQDLAALIPVNRAMAEKRTWAMPFPPLYKRLADKTSGRTLCADDPAAPPGFAKPPAATPLYYELAIQE